MFTHPLRLALASSAFILLGGWTKLAAADDVCCAPMEPAFVVEPVAYVSPAAKSWIFAPSTFTHDPETGARVAQYMRKPPVEPLDDQRAVTSVYRRTRTVNRGPDGSMDTSYQVQAWGNGRGGIDAEWQMFHDVWKESILSGSFYNQSGGTPWRWNNNPWGGGWGNGWNGTWGGPGWNNGWGGGPPWGGGWNNVPWNNGPFNGTGPWNGGGPHGGGHGGGWKSGPHSGGAGHGGGHQGGGRFGNHTN